jgi:hypothetical protein
MAVGESRFFPFTRRNVRFLRLYKYFVRFFERTPLRLPFSSSAADVLQAEKFSYRPEKLMFGEVET